MSSPKRSIKWTSVAPTIPELLRQAPHHQLRLHAGSGWIRLALRLSELLRSSWFRRPFTKTYKGAWYSKLKSSPPLPYDGTCLLLLLSDSPKGKTMFGIGSWGESGGKDLKSSFKGGLSIVFGINCSIISHISYTGSWRGLTTKCLTVLRWSDLKEETLREKTFVPEYVKWQISSTKFIWPKNAVSFPENLNSHIPCPLKLEFIIFLTHIDQVKCPEKIILLVCGRNK